MGICGIYESDAPDVVIDEAPRPDEGAAGRFLDAAGDGGRASRRDRRGRRVGAGGTDRDVLFSSTRLFLEAAAREQPTVLVFEDIHWSGSTLLDLIDTLAVVSHGLPLLLVTLARPEFLDTRDSWGGRLSSYTSLTLGPLDESDSRELAIRRLGAPDRADAVVRVAEGNPLFIEQLAATMEETEGALADEHPRPRRRAPRRAAAARPCAAPRRGRRRQGVLARRAAGAEPRSRHRPRARGARAPRPDPARGELDHREPAAVRRSRTSSSATSPTSSYLAPTARARHEAVAQFFERSTGIVERGDRRARPPLARRGRLRARDRPADACRRAGGARLGEGPRGDALPRGARARARGRRPSGEARSAAGSRSRARRPSTWTTSGGREVRRRDVADDLVDRVDAVLARAGSSGRGRPLRSAPRTRRTCVRCRRRRTTTWLCSQVISGSSSSTISRERRPTAGIWDSPTSKLRTIM